MKFWIFTPPPPSRVKSLVDFWWQIFFHIFPRKCGSKFVTPKTSENFTTFFTAKNEIYPWSSLWGRLRVKKKWGTVGEEALKSKGPLQKHQPLLSLEKKLLYAIQIVLQCFLLSPGP